MTDKYYTPDESEFCVGKTTLHERRKVKTIEGLLVRIYRTQTNKSKLRNHNKPEYTLEEFVDYWKNNNIFLSLFMKWKNSNYDKWLKPSCDRKDNKISYTWNNIQFVTWKENDNKQKSSEEQKQIMRSIKKSHIIPIIQKDLNNNIIKFWKNGTDDIKKEFKSINNIRSVCRGERKQAYNYKWEYAK